MAQAWARERPDLDLHHFLFELFLTRLGRLIERVQEREARERYSLSTADLRLLTALRRSGPPFARSPTNLRRNTLVTAGAITKQVDRLVAEDLVERLQDPLSARAVIIRLTAAGKTMADDVISFRAQHSLLGPTLDATSPAQRETALGVITRLVEALEALEDAREDGEDGARDA